MKCTMKCPHCKGKLEMVVRTFETEIEFTIEEIDADKNELILGEGREYAGDHVRDVCPTCNKEINLFEV